MRQFDPFELQGSATDLLSLCDGLTGFATDERDPSPSRIWLKGAVDEAWVVGVSQRDLEFKFEVFTLKIDTYTNSLQRMGNTVPMPPRTFESWPLSSWRLDVLRRTEYTIGDLQPPPPTFGRNPAAQAAAKAGEVPREAWAACDVAAGLLFTDNGDGKRFLIAVDWMPFDLIVTQDDHIIHEFLELCDVIAVGDYARDFPSLTEEPR